MPAAAALLTLRLLPASPGEAVCGMVLPRQAAAAVLRRLAARRKHYASLRLVATAGRMILLAPEHQPLPWSEATQFFLRQAGPALLPTDRRLDVPARWHDEVVARLAASHRQSLPLLILPTGEGIEVTGLAEARALGEIDLAALAEEIRA
ncbi:hypothetical protein [Labrys neptuniae]